MLKTYFKIFFVTGGLFFLGMLFSDLTLMPFREALISAVSSGLLFGLTMAAVLGTAQILKVRRAAAGEQGRDLYSTTQVREFESGLEYSRLFASVTHYLQKVRGFELTENDADSGRAAARSKFNFTTFGNSVTVRLEKRPGAPTLVRIVSRPLLPTLMCDYGENYRVARGLEDHLKGTQL
ncbi:MAG: hypothetical protein A2X32_00075 [Elusimicrobia bacterium GWC2_64_44]|nr:MAG: hypothetical protein A2X32_00075 [Elusimicrobia bacterium GWC2_64_44]